MYQAATSAERTQRQLIKDLLDKAFAGSAGLLVMQALAAKKASPEELAQIHPARCAAKEEPMIRELLSHPLLIRLGTVLLHSVWLVALSGALAFALLWCLPRQAHTWYCGRLRHAAAGCGTARNRVAPVAGHRRPFRPAAGDIRRESHNPCP